MTDDVYKKITADTFELWESIWREGYLARMEDEKNLKSYLEKKG